MSNLINPTTRQILDEALRVAFATDQATYATVADVDVALQILADDPLLAIKEVDKNEEPDDEYTNVFGESLDGKRFWLCIEQGTSPC